MKYPTVAGHPLYVPSPEGPSTPVKPKFLSLSHIDNGTLCSCYGIRDLMGGGAWTKVVREYRPVSLGPKRPVHPNATPRPGAS